VAHEWHGSRSTQKGSGKRGLGNTQNVRGERETIIVKTLRHQLLSEWGQKKGRGQEKVVRGLLKTDVYKKVTSVSRNGVPKKKKNVKKRRVKRPCGLQKRRGGLRKSANRNGEKGGKLSPEGGKRGGNQGCQWIASPGISRINAIPDEEKDQKPEERGEKKKEKEKKLKQTCSFLQ